MTENISRPPSVWITQVILVFLGLIWGLLSLVHLFITLTTSTDVVQIAVNLVFGLIIAAFSLLFLAGFWGLLKRKGYGRWIGVIALSLILIASIAGNVLRPKGPLEYYEYENSAQLVGGIVGSVFIYGLIILLIYRLAYGDRANAFFAIRTQST